MVHGGPAVHSIVIMAHEQFLVAYGHLMQSMHIYYMIEQPCAFSVRIRWLGPDPT